MRRSRKVWIFDDSRDTFWDHFGSHFPSKIDEQIDAEIDAEKVMKIDEKSMRKWYRN